MSVIPRCNLGERNGTMEGHVRHILEMLEQEGLTVMPHVVFGRIWAGIYRGDKCIYSTRKRFGPDSQLEMLNDIQSYLVDNKQD